MNPSDVAQASWRLADAASNRDRASILAETLGLEDHGVLDLLEEGLKHAYWDGYLDAGGVP